MATKQELRSDETKKSIVAAAGELFSSRGYDAVTMREIAKEAGCSHTTIYIYFKDKEALLHQLSMPPLLSLMEQMEQLLGEQGAPESKLKAISLAFIEFCLANRNMYALFFNVKSVRVDEANPETEINQVRNKLFGKLTGAVRECLHPATDDGGALLSARIYFFALHGIVATYIHSDETVEQLMGRLSETFRITFEVLLTGLNDKATRPAN
ncbi:TetR/AcrR family transcriptional regulator [Cohnella endophytica]|uniref:TetR/AcrR family transcriptional regulator n=1 Tax=Cohnella endophytica TaxID=2419778 RepID=A0A494XUT0_9BACL|nr:TetR/AcrR family transcriptional regulator [Cohnella endophytica]RKP54371.1 TetR/AcrR family transcriptional regulator [Cohnella endophytica]